MKKTLLATLLLLLFVAACNSKNATPLPSPTTIPTYAYASPTPFAIMSTVAASTSEAQQVAFDPTDVAHGQAKYTQLGCDQCHDADGKGNGSKGPALVPMTLSEDDFMTMLRTGGKLGNAHLFASNRLSDTFGHYLYLYVKSLSS